jgi:dephospho-CoA kinase
VVADRPFLVGLTGSIGMGKSETGKMFVRLSVPVYDADAAVHALYEPGGAAVAPIAEAFPDCVKNGRVDRAALAAHVVNSGEALARLEAIVHPLVRATEQAFIDRAAAGGADMVVLNIPLLFETRGETRMDAVLVVSAPEEIQRRRVMARDGMTEEKLAFILSRQMGDAEKRARADYVVDTGAGLTQAFDQVRKIVEELRSKRNARNA